MNGYREGRENFYAVIRRGDGSYVRTRGLPIDDWISGELRLDPAPCWNRTSDRLPSRRLPTIKRGPGKRFCCDSEGIVSMRRFALISLRRALAIGPDSAALDSRNTDIPDTDTHFRAESVLAARIAWDACAMGTAEALSCAGRFSRRPGSIRCRRKLR